MTRWSDCLFSGPVPGERSGRTVLAGYTPGGYGAPMHDSNVLQKKDHPLFKRLFCIKAAIR